MGVKRKQHSAEFKARVAMASLSGEKTLAELSAEFGVHPTMISNWKQELVNVRADAQKVIDDLHRKIGQVQVERDFLAGQPAISRDCGPSACVSIGPLARDLAVARSHPQRRLRGADDRSFREESTTP